MGNDTLMIVESPAKARTIGKLLGAGTKVLASMGHVSDLPTRELGVDIVHDFAPQYELTPNGHRVLKDLKAAAKGAKEIYLATDPDREGEAISWHLERPLRPATKGNFHRISYHEITKSAILNAFAHPGAVEMPLVDAQQARRILDRLVGYQVSPLLWKHVEKDTSAGRVQSVALRLIVEREREIQAFTPVEYWNLEAVFSPRERPEVKLKTRLSKVNGAKANITNGTDAHALASALSDGAVAHTVAAVTSTPRTQRPAPPFITSTLQQAAGSFLHYGTTQTMKLAQELYEGVELGGGDIVGLITYMRTDSVNIANEAQQAALQYIERTYGAAYVPEKPNRYRSGKSAQEAHEAIRPTNVERTPESVAAYLSPMQLKLYRLIWNRFVASQMAPARQVDHAIEIESAGGALAACQLTSEASPSPKRCTFRAAARETVFAGYLKVYSMKDLGQEDEMDDLAGVLPELKEGSDCRLELPLPEPEQCFTQPPGRYSEASLVKALETNGVGRPSTFATVVKTILDRKYVEKEKSALLPTKLGFEVNDYLVNQFPALFDIGFTAKMEGELDAVEEGRMDWVAMLKEFYGQFQTWLAAGGATPTTGTLDAARAQEMLALFPEGYQYDPPVARLRKVYDDGKFVESLREQLATGKKPLSERQCSALLGVLARYAAKDASLRASAEAAGFGALIQQQQAAEAAREERREGGESALALPAGLEELLAAMKGVKWEAPVTRGKRIYDDGKFYRSIMRQVGVSHQLTPPQIAAIEKLASKYAAVIPGYAALAERLGMAPSEAEASDTASAEGKTATVSSGVDAAVCERLLALAAQVHTWREPSKRGRRTYDDQAFVKSLQEQYASRKVLSDRQVAALRGVLGRYADQLPAEAASEFQAEGGAPARPARKAAEALDEACPECGAKLMRRFFRGRSFIGCSNYPKCKYSRKG